MSVWKWLLGGVTAVSVGKRVVSTVQAVDVSRRIANGDYEIVVLRYLHDHASATKEKIRAEVRAVMPTMKQTAVNVADKAIETLLQKAEIYKYSERTRGRSTAIVPKYALLNKGRARINVAPIPDAEEAEKLRSAQEA